MTHKILVLAFQQFRQRGEKILAAAPFAHVVLPTQPQPAGLARHLLLVDQKIRAFEQRDENAEEYGLALLLLFAQRRRRWAAVQQLQVGMFQRQLEEVCVLVGQALVQLLFLVEPLLALLMHEHADRQRQTQHGHHVAEHFHGFQQIHASPCSGWLRYKVRTNTGARSSALIRRA